MQDISSMPVSYTHLRYKDEITGKRNSVYAADLASLREMEKKINKDMDDLLITDASVKKLTVNTLFERYMATKNIKERTKKNYIRMWAVSYTHLEYGRRYAIMQKGVQPDYLMPVKFLGGNTEFDGFAPVSYTHLDVYKRQGI